MPPTEFINLLGHLFIGAAGLAVLAFVMVWPMVYLMLLCAKLWVRRRK